MSGVLRVRKSGTVVDVVYDGTDPATARVEAVRLVAGPDRLGLVESLRQRAEDDPRPEAIRHMAYRLNAEMIGFNEPSVPWVAPPDDPDALY